jgi:hypothetical protein
VSLPADLISVVFYTLIDCLYECGIAENIGAAGQFLYSDGASCMVNNLVVLKQSQERKASYWKLFSAWHSDCMELTVKDEVDSVNVVFNFRTFVDKLTKTLRYFTTKSGTAIICTN